jgi:hypothetical protein
MQKLPVLVTFFNRPSNLELLLKVIANRNDIEIFFACDGPRNTIDESNIQSCWDLVNRYVGKVPTYRTLERSSNLGCKVAMKQNIDWFFNLNEFGLILEDDCIPNDDFFKILPQALLNFASAEDIMCISGTDFVPANLNHSQELFRESLFPMIWGWATWARKWKFYELEIDDHKNVVSSAADHLFGSKNSLKRFYFEDSFNMRFKEVNKGIIDTWDYSLLASMWRNDLKSLQINGNLVINSGFTPDATHTNFTAPDWVPNAYRTPRLGSSAKSEYDPQLDIWLATNVYNCNLIDLVKNTVKKVVRV